MKFIRSFLNKRECKRIIIEYRLSTNNNWDCFSFLIKNGRKICKYYSFETFKEFCLNYRILFDNSNKNKILNDYKKYILNKKIAHKSNLAISYNMIKNIKLDKKTENEIIDYMIKQLDLKDINSFKNHHILIKNHVMDYVKKNIIKKN
jgi:hypothetical protein